MSAQRLLSLLAMAVVALGGRASAQATSRSFFVENDVLLRGFTTDRNYTGGFGFLVGGPEARYALTSDLLRLVDRNPLMRGFRAGHVAQEQYTYGLLASAFTPETIRVSYVSPGDRPYGSIFGLASTRTTHDELELVAWTSQLVVGALGLDISKNAQSEIHRFGRRRCDCLTPYQPAGWHHQISNGGEMTGLYRVQRQHLMFDNITKNVHAELVDDMEGSVGYYKNFAGGLRTRIGHFQSKFWEFNAAPMSSVSQKSTGSNPAAVQGFAFGNVRGRAVTYNALLQGGRRETDYTIPDDDVSRRVFEWDTGVSFVFRLKKGDMTHQARAIGLTWVIVSGRTAEFRGTRMRAHRWGAVHLTFFPWARKP